MNIRFYNAKILTMANGSEIVNGELWVKGERIFAVATPQNPVPLCGEPEWDKEINANGNLIMPGFKNAHTHSAMTFLRSYADDFQLSDWLEKKIFPMEAKLVPQVIEPLCKLAFMEYLTSGITACFDMYMYPEQMARAAIDVGFRVVLCSAMNNFFSSVIEQEQEYIHYNSLHPLISAQLGFHAEYTNNKENLENFAKIAQKYKAPVCTHCAESVDETQGCIERTGKTPPQYLADLGLFEYGGVFYHGVQLTHEDIKLCANKNIAIVTNPGSNTKLASGIAPLCEIMDNDITIAIGTDGAASNNCLDFFREMFLTCGLQKLKQNDAAAMPALNVLQFATIGGAKVMGLSESDILAAGKYADLIMINLNRPNMQPINNIVNNIVYSGSKENVMLTMINGKILYENGEFFIGEPAQDIYAKANEIISRYRQ